jgi:hypothetical protein
MSGQSSRFLSAYFSDVMITVLIDIGENFVEISYFDNQ